jgi:hypothetical protein
VEKIFKVYNLDRVLLSKFYNLHLSIHYLFAKVNLQFYIQYKSLQFIKNCEYYPT